MGNGYQYISRSQTAAKYKFLNIVSRNAFHNKPLDLSGKFIGKKLFSLAIYSIISLLNFPIVSLAENLDDTLKSVKISRSDVGLIDLNIEEPTVTDICWFDLKIGDVSSPQRVEVSLYGKYNL